MKKTINLFKGKWIIFILFYLLIPVYGTGQILISTDPGDYPAGTTFASGRMHLPGIHVNEIKDFDIPVLVALPYTITPPTGSGPCSEINLNNSVTIVNDHFARVQVTDMCSFDQSSYLDFTLNISKSGHTPEAHMYRVPILRDSAKVVLTLDISGSMGATLDDGSTTRLQALKNGVYELVAKLEEFQQEGDSLGLTYFTTTVVQPEIANFPKDFIPIADNTTNLSFLAVYTDLDSRTQQQMTNMGAGLLDAKEKLLKYKDEAPNTKRMAFLFTDGMQNQYPRVLADGIELEDGKFLNDNQPNPKDSIRYFVLATWDAGVGIETLVKIGEESGGATTYANPGADLTTWFNDQLTNMLSNGSPQVITNKEGNSIIDSVKYTFDLNEGITKLLIDFSSLDADSLNIIIKKDGKNIAHEAKVRTQDNYRLFSFVFPIKENGYIHSGGIWEVTLIGNSGKPYHLSAIADDHYLDLNCNTDKKIYTVGDPIKFSTNLLYANEPVFGGTNSVKAIVLKPGEDLGDLLARAQTPDMDSIVDTGDGASMKFQELMANDSAFYNSILPSEQIIDLTDNGDGTFTGEYANTEFTGIYNIIFLIKGETTDYGKFERTDIVSAVFKFGQVEEEAPEVVDNPPASSGNAPQYTILRIRPKNKFGYFMGPGYKSKIKVAINKKPVGFIKSARAQHVSEPGISKTDPYLEKIVDNLDGSYLIYVANVSAEDNPDISITVRDEVLYEGKLKQIPLWYYLLAILIIILLILLKKAKESNSVKLVRVILWILVIIVFILYLLHTLGVMTLFFM